MIAPDASKPNWDRVGRRESDHSPDLPFRIELWEHQRSKVERVLARAHTANLAQVIFRAACEQYPGRRLSLWHGCERIAETS